MLSCKFSVQFNIFILFWQIQSSFRSRPFVGCCCFRLFCFVLFGCAWICASVCAAWFYLFPFWIENVVSWSNRKTEWQYYVYMYLAIYTAIEHWAHKIGKKTTKKMIRVNEFIQTHNRNGWKLKIVKRCERKHADRKKKTKLKPFSWPRSSLRFAIALQNSLFHSIYFIIFLCILAHCRLTVWYIRACHLESVYAEKEREKNHANLISPSPSPVTH